MKYERALQWLHYQREPDKDLNGLITTIPVALAVTLAPPYRASIAGSTAMFQQLKHIRESSLLIGAIQVDSGSEFEAAFEEECQRRNIKLLIT